MYGIPQVMNTNSSNIKDGQCYNWTHTAPRYGQCYKFLGQHYWSCTYPQDWLCQQIGPGLARSHTDHCHSHRKPVSNLWDKESSQFMDCHQLFHCRTGSGRLVGWTQSTIWGIHIPLWFNISQYLCLHCQIWCPIGNSGITYSFQHELMLK